MMLCSLAFSVMRGSRILPIFPGGRMACTHPITGELLDILALVLLSRFIRSKVVNCSPGTIECIEDPAANAPFHLGASLSSTLSGLARSSLSVRISGSRWGISYCFASSSSSSFSKSAFLTPLSRASFLLMATAMWVPIHKVSIVDQCGSSIQKVSMDQFGSSILLSGSQSGGRSGSRDDCRSGSRSSGWSGGWSGRRSGNRVAVEMTARVAAAAYLIIVTHQGRDPRLRTALPRGLTRHPFSRHRR